MFITINVPGLKLPEGVTGIQLLPDTLKESGEDTSNVTTGKRTKKKTPQKEEKEKAPQKSREIGDVSSTSLPPATVDQFKDLWNKYAEQYKWTPLRIISQDIRDRFNKARKELPKLDMWETSLKGLASDHFFGGQSGQYKAKVLTLFYKNRYMDFYNTGLSLGDTKTEVDILTDWGSKLAAIEIPTLNLPLVMPNDADKDS